MAKNIFLKKIGSTPDFSQLSIGDLNDVIITSIEDGQVLIYNNNTNSFENKSDIEFDILEFQVRENPGTPVVDSKYMYLKASGTTPNRQLVQVLKNETGEEIIVSSVIV
jgi:hypothetical protein